ncbi:MAG TPA: cation-translocating P-type ATPase [Anaerolineae bacterium]
MDGERARDLWYSLSAHEALARLETQYSSGLSSGEAADRLARDGANELKEAPQPTFWHRLLGQLSDFLVLILLAASLVSLLLGDYVEAAAIMAIVVLNAVLGVVQEARAEQSLAALRKMTAPEAHVVRDGRYQTIPARELVPGDIIILETGNYVPADARLLEAVNLKIDESSLTGESVAVQKSADVVLEPGAPLGDRHNSAFMSTLVTYGRGRAVVVATGMRSEIGLIAEMIQSFETEPTPLQRQLAALGKTLGIGALAICGVVFVVGVLRFLLGPVASVPGMAAPVGSGLAAVLHSGLVRAIFDQFIVAVSLAIAAVPEGLPAVVTICLALGMQRMIQRHALLRRLPAVEALGSATAICSDKTGTLTQNAMTVVQVWADDTLLSVTGDGYAPEGDFLEDDAPVDASQYPGVGVLLRTLLLCNDAGLEPVPGQDVATAADDQDDGAGARPSAAAGWPAPPRAAHPAENDPAAAGTGRRRRAWRVIGDPTEGALVVVAAKAGYQRDEVSRDFPRLAEIPFDSDRKLMTTIHRVYGSLPADSGPAEAAPARTAAAETAAAGPAGDPPPYIALVKGAPDVLLERCTHLLRDRQSIPLTAEDRARIAEVNGSLAANALRVLAAAVRPLETLPEGDDLTPGKIERGLIFAGLVGMIDPARPEVKPAIAQARAAGIKTVMITGDYPNTAAAIGREIGLLAKDGHVLTGSQLDALTDEQFARQVEGVSVYARVSPQHKVRIVEALRDRGHVVAMTGDGVNDAPALKRADIGVAMGITGTDVSKETAAMVLTDDNYASIVAAVEEGRVIYANIRKFVYYLLSCNMGEILVIFIATMLGWPLPLMAIHLLVLNLITDGAPALALGLERAEPDVMQRPPRRPDEPIINRRMVTGIIVQAVAIAFAVLLAFRLALAAYAGSLPHAQTIAFATLSISELARAYTARSERFNIWRLPLFGNRSMQLAIASSLAILLAIIYLPILDPIFKTTFLTLRDWALMLPLILLPSVAAEITKIAQRDR